MSERLPPCRFSTVHNRWECITWPGRGTAYPCAHSHAHCDAMGCVSHDEGMHTDARGDVITHVGCGLCQPERKAGRVRMTAHPVSDVLREALERYVRSKR